MEELRPDLDEIRRELRPPRRGISTGAGLVLAAIILVTGYWGGRYLLYEQEARRIDAALMKLGRSIGLSSQAQSVQPHSQRQVQPRPQARYQDPTAMAWQSPVTRAVTDARMDAIRELQASQMRRAEQARLETKAQAEANRKRQRQIEAQRKAEFEAWHSLECRFWWERNRMPYHKAKELTACKPYVQMPISR